MTLNRTMALCLLSSLVICPLASAGALRASGKAYQVIAERNVFGLRPEPAPVPPTPPPPLPNIKLTCITTILGDKRAVFEVQMPAAPPQPAKEEHYTIVEGQREGPIEVLAIDLKAETVKVNNSGTVMVLSFAKDSPQSADSPRWTSQPATPRSLHLAHRMPGH